MVESTSVEQIATTIVQETHILRTRIQTAPDVFWLYQRAYARRGTRVRASHIKQTVGAGHLLTSALCKPDWPQGCSRSTSRKKWSLVVLGALLILLALGVPASADDPIAEWLKQDEVDSQIDEVRPDLKCTHRPATARDVQDWARTSR